MRIVSFVMMCGASKFPYSFPYLMGMQFYLLWSYFNLVTIHVHYTIWWRSRRGNGCRGSRRDSSRAWCTTTWASCQKRKCLRSQMVKAKCSQKPQKYNETLISGAQLLEPRRRTLKDPWFFSKEKIRARKRYLDKGFAWPTILYTFLFNQGGHLNTPLIATRERKQNLVRASFVRESTVKAK